MWSDICVFVWQIFVACSDISVFVWQIFVACSDICVCVWQILVLGTYLVTSCFFNVYDMAVDTLFLCFCEYSMFVCVCVHACVHCIVWVSECVCVCFSEDEECLWPLTFSVSVSVILCVVSNLFGFYLYVMSEDLKFCNHQYRGHNCFGTRLIDTVVVPAVTDILMNWWLCCLFQWKVWRELKQQFWQLLTC